MKKGSVLIPLLCLLGKIGSAQAVVPTTLYDNFVTSLINPTKWFGGNYDDPRGNLESLRHIAPHATLTNRLHLYLRGYGASGLNIGVRPGNNVLNFRNANPINAIKASVWVNSATVLGCPGNLEVSRVRARIGGTFFNTTPHPIPGDSTYDVLAQIRLQRASNSTDPANITRVGYTVTLCLDRECFNGPILASGEIGTPVAPGQKVTLSVEWEKANKRFIFRRDALSAIATYSYSDSSLPGNSYKNIQVAHFTANCTTATPLVSAIDAYFDDVYTNVIPSTLPMSAGMEQIDPQHIFYSDTAEDPAGP